MVASEQVVVTGQQLETLCINTIRTLAMDAVQQANSGHPGAPMGLAPVTYCLWQDFLRYDPADPTWLNRDRFVLSNGHASMLLYAMLNLAEVRRVDEHGQVLKELSVPMEEIKRFRQLGSRTPGHPESHLTSGVETTTGPLGQGVGNSVGIAMASKWLAANFNRPGLEIFDFNVYAVCSDGDLMEGIGGEAASLAGHLRSRQSLLGVRPQSHHARRSGELVVLRRCGHAVYRIRLERDACDRCQRSGNAGAGV
jgi:transketolase